MLPILVSNVVLKITLNKSKPDGSTVTIFDAIRSYM